MHSLGTTWVSRPFLDPTKGLVPSLGSCMEVSYCTFLWHWLQGLCLHAALDGLLQSNPRKLSDAMNGERYWCWLVNVLSLRTDTTIKQQALIFIVGYCPPCVYPLSTRQTQHIIMEYYFQWRKFKCPLGGNRECGCLISDTWKCGFTLSQHTHTYTHIHTCDTRVIKNLQVWCWRSVNLKVLLQVPNEFEETGTPKQQNDCRTRLMKNNTKGSWVMCPTCLCCWILLKLYWQACCPCARWGVLYPCIQKCW